MMLKTEAMPPMIAVQMLAIPLTMAMRTLPGKVLVMKVTYFEVTKTFCYSAVSRQRPLQRTTTRLEEEYYAPIARNTPWIQLTTAPIVMCA